MKPRTARWLTWIYAAFAVVVVGAFGVANGYGYAVFGETAEQDDSNSGSNHSGTHRYHK